MKSNRNSNFDPTRIDRLIMRYCVEECSSRGIEMNKENMEQLQLEFLFGITDRKRAI